MKKASSAPRVASVSQAASDNRSSNLSVFDRLRRHGLVVTEVVKKEAKMEPEEPSTEAAQSHSDSSVEVVDVVQGRRSEDVELSDEESHPTTAAGQQMSLETEIQEELQQGFDDDDMSDVDEAEGRGSEEKEEGSGGEEEEQRDDSFAEEDDEAADEEESEESQDDAEDDDGGKDRENEDSQAPRKSRKPAKHRIEREHHAEFYQVSFI